MGLAVVNATLDGNPVALRTDEPPLLPWVLPLSPKLLFFMKNSTRFMVPGDRW